MPSMPSIPLVTKEDMELSNNAKSAVKVAGAVSIATIMWTLINSVFAFFSGAVSASGAASYMWVILKSVALSFFGFLGIAFILDTVLSYGKRAVVTNLTASELKKMQAQQTPQPQQQPVEQRDILS